MVNILICTKFNQCFGVFMQIRIRVGETQITNKIFKKLYQKNLI